MKSNTNLGRKDIHEYLSLKMHKKEDKIFCLLFLSFPPYNNDIENTVRMLYAPNIFIKLRNIILDVVSKMIFCQPCLHS